MIKSVYWIKLRRQVLDKTLYVFDISDVRLYLEKVYRHFWVDTCNKAILFCVELVRS